MTPKSKGIDKLIERRALLKGGTFAVACLWLGCSANEDNSNAAQVRLSATDAGLPDASGDGDADAGGSNASSGRPDPGAFDDSRTPILWIETGICSGCAISLLNAAGLLAALPAVRLEFQETIMDGFGAPGLARIDAIIASYSGKYAMIVDGAIPTGAMAGMTKVGTDATGKEWTAYDMVRKVAAGATAVVSLGTCSSWGGIPSAAPNLGNYKSLWEVLDQKPLIRVPGCPPNPDWILGTLVALLTGQNLPVDMLGRPSQFYGKTNHDLCPRKPMHDANRFATQPGDPAQCLRMVGCKGPIAHADCVTRLYLGRSSCIKAGHPCIGCVAPGFPDPRPSSPEPLGASPFYTRIV